MFKNFTGLFKIVIHIIFNWLIKVALTKDKNRMNSKFISSGICLVELEKTLVNKIKIFGKILKSDSNKVNILVSNHNSTIDFIVICAMIYKFEIDNFYFIFKKGLLKIPFLGSLLKEDISINRNWDQDKENIKEQLKKINNGYIIIYPEGTRYSKKKHMESLNFSYINKLPFFNYTLTPKVRGTHLIFSSLLEQNKLGDVYDMTIIFPKYINKELYLKKIINDSNLGDLFIFFKKIHFNKKEIDYELFKKKIFTIWFDKNIIIDFVHRKKIL